MNRDMAWKKLMTPLGEKWMSRFDAASKQEGWALFNHDGTLQIQALDDPETETGQVHLPGGDAQAYDLIAKKAAKGSKMHLLALFIDGHDGTGCFDVPKFLLTEKRNGC